MSAGNESDGEDVSLEDERWKEGEIHKKTKKTFGILPFPQLIPASKPAQYGWCLWCLRALHHYPLCSEGARSIYFHSIFWVSFSLPTVLWLKRRINGVYVQDAKTEAILRLSCFVSLDNRPTQAHFNVFITPSSVSKLHNFFILSIQLRHRLLPFKRRSRLFVIMGGKPTSLRGY